MALPNGSGGYQVGDGNLGEPLFFMQGAPTALTAAATATTAQLVNGLFTFNGTAGDLTLPSVADLEEDYPSLGEKADSSFDFFVINIDAGTDDVTVAIGSGWTLVGAGQVDNGTSGHFRCRKTGSGAWTVYRVS
jgi:hypothetical protein